MTLSSWLRDYLYIPLGGNRRGKYRTYVNLMATMLIGGLWHGASWTFVIWGMLHGVGLAFHKLISRRQESNISLVRQMASWACTFGFVYFTWIFFRASDFSTALLIVRKILGLAPGGMVFVYSPLFMLLPLVVLGHVMGLLAARQADAAGVRGHQIPAPTALVGLYNESKTPFATKPHRQSGIYVLLPTPTVSGAFGLAIWLLAVILFTAGQSQPFIYFQF